MDFLKTSIGDLYVAMRIAVDRRVMTKQLDELVQHGFVDKFFFDTKIPKVEYRLTDLGISLLPLIISLERWGENNRAVLEEALNEKNDQIILNPDSI